MASITTTRRTNGTGTATLPARRCFTVDEYDRMIQTGIVREGERVELLAGEIIQMAAMGSRHAACIADLNEWFVPRRHRSCYYRHPASDSTLGHLGTRA